MKEYDLIVIGAGGGTKISTPVAKMGLKVAIIEKEDLGGTCLNRGCIPSKMLIHPSNVLEQVKSLGKYNISHQGKFEVDFTTLVKRVSDTVDKESLSIGEAYKEIDTLDHYNGEASFVSNKIVKINETEITAPKIIIAVGSRPSTPDIPGLAGTPYMTSREALRREKQPKKLLIIGGGYIATELGHVYNALGTDTTFFVRNHYLSYEDETISAEFQNAFEQKHKTIYGTRNLKVSYTDKEFTLSGEDKDGNPVSETGDALLVATGVEPNTDSLNLNNTNIKQNEHGYIAVNDHLETDANGVYAIGDCVGNYLFRHSVNFEGEYLLGQLFQSETKGPIIYPPMPHAVFTSPEIAGVGKTEQQLKKEGADYLAVNHKYINSAQGMARLPEEGLVKLMFDKDSKKLIGAHIIGEEAATMVHHLILGITMGATSEDLLKMIYIHPALPEIVRNAVRKAEAEFAKISHAEHN